MARSRKTQDDEQPYDPFPAVTGAAMSLMPEPPASVYDPGALGDDLSDDLALQTALTQLGEDAEDARLIVYSMNSDNRKEVFLYETTVAEFSISGLAEIQERYGAGDYKIRVYRSGRGILAHRKISIGPSRKVAPAAQASMADVMAEQTRMFMAGLERIAAMQAQPRADAGMGIKETIGLISALQPLMGGTRQAPSADPLELLERMLSIQKSLAPLPTNSDGDVASGTIMLEALKQFGPLLASAASAAKPSFPEVQPNPVMIPAQSQILPPPVQTPQPIEKENKMEADDMNDLAVALTTARPLIVTAAATNADPGTYAGMLFDFAPEAEIRDLATRPDWFDIVQKAIPEATQYREWFEEFHAIVNEILNEQPKPATLAETTPPGSTDANPVPDAAKTD